MKKHYNTINKQRLIKLVSKKINHQIHHTHINDIVSLFIDEFISTLNHKKQLNIHNFCSFRVEKNKPRKFYDIHKRRFAISNSKYLLKIKLHRALRNKIIKNLDLIKTFL